jgi:hypothetical protein
MGKLDDGALQDQRQDDQLEDSEQADDTEGHSFLLPPDAGTARNLANARSRDMERDSRTRNLEREARGNKQTRPNRP